MLAFKQMGKALTWLRRLFSGRLFKTEVKDASVAFGNAAGLQRPVSPAVYETIIIEGANGERDILEEFGPTPVDDRQTAEDILREFQPRGLADASSMLGTVEGFCMGGEKIAQEHYVSMDQHKTFQSAEDRRKLERLQNNYRKLDDLRKGKKETGEQLTIAAADKINLVAQRTQVRQQANLASVKAIFQRRVLGGLLAGAVLAVGAYYVCAYFLYSYADEFMSLAQQAEARGDNPQGEFKGIIGVLPQALSTWGGHWPFAIFTTLFLIAGQPFIRQHFGFPASIGADTGPRKKVGLLNVMLLLGVLILDLLIAYHVQVKRVEVEVLMGLTEEQNPSPWNAELGLMLFLGFVTGVVGSCFFVAYEAIQDQHNALAEAEIKVTDIERQLTLLSLKIQLAEEQLKDLKDKIQVLVEKIVALTAELNTRLVTYWTLLLKWRAYQAGYCEFVVKHNNLSAEAIKVRLKEIQEVFEQLQAKYIPTHSRPTIV